MAIEKHFIDENVKKLIIRKFTQDELSKVGCGDVDIFRTPLGMRISIHAEKPGLVIGRKGKTIHKLTDTFINDFKLENPQLEVQQIEVPELNASLMAQKIAGAMERGIHFRRAVYSTMKRIRSAGALGCQVTVSGKITGERARMSKFTDGFIKHAGEQKNEYIQVGYAQALLKPGVLGVKVILVPPDANLKEIIYLGDTPAELEPLETVEEKKEAGEAKPEPEAKDIAKPEEKDAKKEETPKKSAKKKAETPKEEKPKVVKAQKPDVPKKAAKKKTTKKPAKAESEAKPEEANPSGATQAKTNSVEAKPAEESGVTNGDTQN